MMETWYSALQPFAPFPCVRMVESAQAQATLIEDLLDTSRIVSGKLRLTPQPTHLADGVEAARSRPAAGPA
jgi:signal transduction histidine kinase